MPDEQVAQATETTPASSQTASTAGQEQRPVNKGSWLDRILGRARSEEAPAPTSEQTQAASEQQSTEQAQETAGEAKPKREVSDEELQRLVQAEVDRREAKRQAEARKARRRELRQSDPLEFARLDEQEEQQQAASQHFASFAGGIIQDYDRATLDPIMLALPEAARKDVLAKGGEGLDGRRALTSAALEALKSHYLAEGEQRAAEKLRKDPAFRKQVLVEWRGGREEPDNVPAVNSTGAGENNWLRNVLNSPKK